MQTIIIMTPTNITIKCFIDNIPDIYKIEKQSDNRYLISSGLEHCWIEYDDELKSYYDEDEMFIITRYIPVPKYFICEFSEIAFGKKILTYIIFDDKFVIDNNHGEILNGGEFLKKLRNEPDWDWRI